MKGAHFKKFLTQRSSSMIQSKSMVTQEELLLTNRKTKSYQKLFSSKFTALSKAHRNLGDVIKNKTEKQARDNDVIHVTKYDNFPQRFFSGILHYGLSSRKNYHKGKIMCMPGFNKNVTDVTEKLQGERANILQAILWYMANGEQGEYRNIVSLSYKIIPTQNN